MSCGQQDFVLFVWIVLHLSVSHFHYPFLLSHLSNRLFHICLKYIQVFVHQEYFFQLCYYQLPSLFFLPSFMKHTAVFITLSCSPWHTIQATFNVWCPITLYSLHPFYKENGSHRAVYLPQGTKESTSSLSPFSLLSPRFISWSVFWISLPTTPFQQEHLTLSFSSSFPDYLSSSSLVLQSPPQHTSNHLTPC